jgi:hypothetical protein
MAANMRKEAENVNTKSITGFGAALRSAFVIDKRLGSSVGRAVD